MSHRDRGEPDRARFCQWAQRASVIPVKMGAQNLGAINLVIGVLGRSDDEPKLREARLLDERLVCVVRKGHALTRGRLTLARYANASHVLIAPRGRAGGPIDDALAERGLSRRIAVAVPHFLAAPHIVATTDLVLTMAARLAASFAKALPLSILPLPFELPSVCAALFWHDRHDSDPAHTWFRQRILKLAHQVAPPQPRIEFKRGATARPETGSAPGFNRAAQIGSRSTRR